MSFDKLRTNANPLIQFLFSLSNHERNQLNDRCNYTVPLGYGLSRLLKEAQSLGQNSSSAIYRLIIIGCI